MKNERYELNKNLAQMLKGGVIMDVTTPEQAKIAEAAGACAVMALERIPADIRAAGGVSRMSDPKMIKGIQEAVSIPVMAKCRIGHFAEAQILQAIEIDYIDESKQVVKYAAVRDRGTSVQILVSGDKDGKPVALSNDVLTHRDREDRPQNRCAYQNVNP